MSNFTFDGPASGHIRPSWNTVHMLIRGRLTDRKIAQYERLGYYSSEYRTARRERMAKQQSQRLKRDGSFVTRDGRLIYAP
jgi:hypothetical protein